MELKRATLAGSGIIFATVAAAALYVGLTISTISVGGPVVASNQQASDLVADILPPPVYILESYLEARLAMVERDRVGQHSERLALLQEEYEARQAHWRSSSLPGALKSQLVRVDAPAQQFFAELEERFLPSLKRGDIATATDSIGRLGTTYAAHRREIDRLVEQTAAYQAETREAGEAQAQWAFWGMALAGIALALVLGLANVLLSRFAISPLKAVADTMRRMAGGDLEARARIDKPVDEIGDMIASLEIFRDASKARLAAEEKQALVVRELTGGLDALAAKKLTHRIETGFPAEYEALRISFNDTMAGLCDVLKQTASSAGNVLIGASQHSVADGVALVDETGSVLLQIGQRVAAINARIADIAESAQVQAVRLQQVNLAVGDMDKMTQQNAAMVEQSNAAARSLAEEATDLAAMVREFETGHGQSARSAFPNRPGQRTAPTTRAAMPGIAGNLALQPAMQDEDWSAF